MSKHTLYFNNVEEANQYFPDGVPSNVIAIVGDGSQVLVSSDNNNTTNQQYYNADLTNDEIVNEMVQTSYDEGHSDGYAAGEAADNYAKKYFTIEFTEMTDVTEYTDPDTQELVEYTPTFSIGLNCEDPTENSTVYIRVNGGEWQHLTDEYISHPKVGDIIEIKATCNTFDEMLCFETADESWFYDAENDTWPTGYKYNFYGNIMSLLKGDDFDGATLDDNYKNQFDLAFGGYGVVDTRNLILPENTTDSCYAHMFMWSEFLTHAPILRAQTLSENCYTDMFNGCSALEYVVILAEDDEDDINYNILFGTNSGTGETIDYVFGGNYEGYLVTLFDKYKEMDQDAAVMIYDPTTQSQYYSDDCEDFCLRLHGLTEAYDDGYTEGEASAVPSYTDSQKFAISSADMLNKGSLNNINYGIMSPSFSFDTSIWSSLTQMARGHYAILYKWSGSTMTTLPFYSNYDEEVGTTPVTINVDTQDALEITDSLIYATATLAAGDKICVGFYVSDEYNNAGQLSGITSASSLYTIQTAGDYIIVVYTGGYDDETGEPLPPTTVISSNPYNASGVVLPIQPVQS